MWTRIEVVAAFAAVAGISLSVMGAPKTESVRTYPTSQAVEVDFAEQILPIFQESCTSCHGDTNEDGFEIAEAGLYLTSYKGVMAGSEFGSVVDPGDVESLLLLMVEDGDMPEGGDRLSDEKIELIKNWILEGAKETAGN